MVALSAFPTQLRMKLWNLFQAWFVMACSFLVNGIVFSIINTFGILFVKVGE